jgi:hypothetical protein
VPLGIEQAAGAGAGHIQRRPQVHSFRAVKISILFNDVDRGRFPVHQDEFVETRDNPLRG